MRHTNLAARVKWHLTSCAIFHHLIFCKKIRNMEEIIRGIALSACLMTTSASPTLGQKVGSENRVLISTGPRYQLNGNGIVSDKMGPQPIATRNTFGFALAGGYQRRARLGVLFGGDLQLRQQTHEVSVEYDFKDFDPSAVNSLRDARPFIQPYNNTLIYLDQRLHVGYEWTMFKTRSPLRMQVSFGIRTSIAIRRQIFETGNTDFQVGYFNDLQDTFSITTFTRITTNLDPLTGPQQNGSRRIGFGLSGYDFYLGIMQPTTGGWLRGVSAGVELSTPYWFKRPGEGAISLSALSFDKDGNAVGLDSYIGTPLAISVKLGVILSK